MAGNGTAGAPGLTAAPWTECCGPGVCQGLCPDSYTTSHSHWRCTQLCASTYQMRRQTLRDPSEVMEANGWLDSRCESPDSHCQAPPCVHLHLRPEAGLAGPSPGGVKARGGGLRPLWHVGEMHIPPRQRKSVWTSSQPCHATANAGVEHGLPGASTPTHMLLVRSTPTPGDCPGHPGLCPRRERVSGHSAEAGGVRARLEPRDDLAGLLTRQQEPRSFPRFSQGQL